MAKIKLFCFPYAGGSAQVYQNWAKDLDAAVELIPIELSGRGERFNDPLYKDFEEMVDDVFHKIYNDIVQAPYALFGHSLGSLIVFELVQKIVAHKLPAPKHVFYSGKGAPHIERKKSLVYHVLDNATFKQEIIKLGGTPAAIFEHPELEQLFLPLLKNDFKLAETYNFKDGKTLYDGEISVLLGKEDDLTAVQCHEWSNATSGICHVTYFNGGHFFIHHETEKIIQLINAALSR